MKDSNNSKKRQRKLEDEGAEAEDGDSDRELNKKNNNNKKTKNNNTRKKKTTTKDLKGILSSYILLEEEEKQEQEELDRDANEERLFIDSNHRKKTKQMVDYYYSNIQDYCTELDHLDQNSRKKSRLSVAVTGAVASAAAAVAGSRPST